MGLVVFMPNKKRSRSKLRIRIAYIATITTKELEKITSHFKSPFYLKANNGKKILLSNLARPFLINTFLLVLFLINFLLIILVLYFLFSFSKGRTYGKKK